VDVFLGLMAMLDVLLFLVLLLLRMMLGGYRIGAFEVIVLAASLLYSGIRYWILDMRYDG
jgi:hypothetical protein